MSNKEFNPSGVAHKNGNYFGVPFSPEESEIVILPMPWDVTTSYQDGTSRGPKAMLDASYQLDLYSPFLEHAFHTKIGTLPSPKKIAALNTRLRKEAKAIIAFLESGKDLSKNKLLQKRLEKLNRDSAAAHKFVESEVHHWRQKGKKVILLGGDHSSSFGAIKATAEDLGNLSILHFDAHADLREAYEGFTHSHASIMFNALELSEVTQLTQVGLRDVCEEELAIIRSNRKVKSFFDMDLKSKLAAGTSWADICTQIIERLGTNVYVSFDIDGLDPKLCPHTGTPVPGGLEIHEALILIHKVVESGRKIVGADLVEVAPSGFKGDEWDANVGARVLYQVCQLMKKSMSSDFVLTHSKQRHSMAL